MPFGFDRSQSCHAAANPRLLLTARSAVVLGVVAFLAACAPEATLPPGSSGGSYGAGGGSTGGSSAGGSVASGGTGGGLGGNVSIGGAVLAGGGSSGGAPLAGGGPPGGVENSGGAAFGGGASGGGPHSGGASAGGASPLLGPELNDVSFLFPLPTWAARDTLLLPSSSGTQGVLLSRTLYDSVAPPNLLEQGLPGNPADIYASLRVVSARVDPCFPADATNPPPCVTQIRLVLQPTSQDGTTPALTTHDAAVHALYELSDPLWESLVSDVMALRDLTHGATEGQPLQVHPVMRSEGLNGTYATALRALVLNYAGETTLSELAFMALGKPSGFWTFTKVVKQGSTFKAIVIPSLAEQAQQAIVNPLGDEAATSPREIFVSPEPVDSLIQFLPDTTVSEIVAEAAMRDALLVDNPKSTKNPQTMDCATCHMSTRNRSYNEKTRGLDTSAWVERFQDSDFDLSRVDEVGDDPLSLRNFGYFGTKSSISDRTIHESAVVARALSH